jgi:hypothetical protein
MLVLSAILAMYYYTSIQSPPFLQKPAMQCQSIWASEIERIAKALLKRRVVVCVCALSSTDVP